MKILVINSGSSSVKYQLFDARAFDVLVAGVIQRIGEPESPLKDHRQALQQIAKKLAESGEVEKAGDLFGISHRVAHGGEDFREPALIDEQVLAAIRRQIPLAPLHNPANLLSIEVTMQQYPATPQVAVFDTAFHQTIPQQAYRYALPGELYQQHKIRRYGFHGTSHFHVAKQAARLLSRPLSELNLIVLHLGNGASATAIRGGQSVDTSMGLTPLEGLVMGTRCGDIDPGIIIHLARAAGKSIDAIDSLLNQQSGLKGICGENDMREVVRRAGEGDRQAELAVEMYAYRIKKYIGAYSAVLPGIDAIVFTAGIGENSAEIRARACADLKHLGIELDETKNGARNDGPRAIQPDGSKVAILVIPTNEEREIAEQAVRCIERRHSTARVSKDDCCR